jgi:Cu2+-exporting ATPase
MDPQRGVMTAVAILVVTCPCALSLATPTAMLAAAGALARAGVLVRKLGAIEVLARVDTFVFDKTGTLTGDSLALVATECRDGVDAQAALSTACALAQHSLHPASRSLVRALAPDPKAPLLRCTMVKETAGQGVQGVLWERANGQSPRNLGPLRLGSAAWCGVDAAQADNSDAAGVRVYVSDAQGWLATFVLGEALRPGAAAVVAALQAQGVQVQLLSGDRAASVAAIAQTVGIATARGDCSPADKLAALHALQAQGRVVAMVGDGLNDTPALAAAAVSFSFSATVAVSQVHADFVVLGQSLDAVLRTRQLAQRTMAIVRQNLWWALVYNAACVPAAVMGYVSPWLAGLGMALSSLFVVLNALRLAR